MKRLASPVSVMVACGLIMLTNLALLAAAGWNRQGGAATELSLTEREFSIHTARQDEGTGLELALVMTNDPPDVIERTARWKQVELPAVPLDWLDGAKLRELGFRVDLDPAHPDAAKYYQHAMVRRAYIVVEYDGEAWQHWLGSREAHVRKIRNKAEQGFAEAGELANAEALLAIDRVQRSRLFPVDAGLDANALKHRYTNSRQHAVMAGLIRPKLVRSENGVPSLSGDVVQLVINRVYVSREHRRHVEPFISQETWQEIETRERREAEIGWPSPTPPRYHATLAVGHRQEPWLVSVETLEP